MGEAAFHWSLGASLRRQIEDQSQEAWRVGDVIGGHYTIVSQLGSGAIGVVYRAHDDEAGREVAIKTLHRDCDVARFQREGELAAALVHPGIGRVYTSGREGGRAFIVYELIEGCRPLSEVLPELERPERLRIVAEVARAVGHAHRQGVVHRDIKPDNIVLDREGRAKVIDFGLGKREAGDDPALTDDGALVGTPLYMSPEQFAGDASGPGVDVWALGVLLYLALTDRHPFHASGLAELAERVQRTDARSPASVDPSVPPALARVCLRALARDPGRRYADASAFAEALAEPERRRRGAPLLGLAVVGVLAAVVVTVAVGSAKLPHVPGPVAAVDEGLEATATAALRRQDTATFVATVERAIDGGRLDLVGTLLERARGQLSPSCALHLVEARWVDARGDDPTQLLREAMATWPDAPEPVERLATRTLRRGYPHAARRLLQQRPKAAPALDEVLVALLAEPRDPAALERVPGRWRPSVARWLVEEGIRRAAWYRRRGTPGARTSPRAVPTAALRAQARRDLEAAQRLGLDASLAPRAAEALMWLAPEVPNPSADAERATAMMVELEAEIGAARSGISRDGIERRLADVLALDRNNARALLVRASLGNVLDPAGWASAARAVTLDPSGLTRLHRRVRERLYIASRGPDAVPLLPALVASDDRIEGALAGALAVELEGGEAGAALRQLTAVLSADPGNVPARVFRIHVATRAGDLERAEADQRALAEELPDSGLAIFYGALLLARRQAPAAQVLAQLKRATQHGVRAIVTAQLRAHRGTYAELNPYASLPAFRRLFFAEGPARAGD